jgi:FKBP-type peptidyl-prolyl cis-trans isomerase 2
MVKVGNVIELDIKENDGEEATSFAMIKEIKENQVLLDLNHPLAGIEIKFKVKIIKVYE